MKNTWLAGILLGLMVLTFACDNDLDLTAEYKDIPVVYGVFSRANEVNYVKIEKAFLGADGENALEIAQIPDSVFYANIDVSLERLSDNRVYNLERVLASDEGIEREEGVFVSDPFYLYKLELPEDDELVGGGEYELTINRGDDKPLIKATTVILDDFTFNLPATPGEITIRYRNQGLSWINNDEAAFYDVKMKLRFLEQNPDDQLYYEDSILWPVDEFQIAQVGDANFAYDLDGEAMFRYLGNTLDDNEGFGRIFVNFDFIIDVAGHEIKDYIDITQANTGITSSQVVPNFTNLSEGFGIFSSKNSLTHGSFTLKPESMDSLANGIYTKDLGFQF